jgi:hypothetical protein
MEIVTASPESPVPQIRMGESCCRTIWSPKTFETATSAKVDETGKSELARNAAVERWYFLVMRWVEIEFLAGLRQGPRVE